MTAEEFDRLKIGDKVYTAYIDSEKNISVLYGEIQSLASWRTGWLKTSKGIKRIIHESVFHKRTEAVQCAIKCLKIDINDQKHYIEVAQKRILESEKNIKKLQNDNRTF